MSPTIPVSDLVKSSLTESCHIQLISPILHIGSAVSQLNPFEYVQTSDRIYLPQHNLLAQALYDRGGLQEYIQLVHDKQPLESLLKRKFGEDWQSAQVAERPIFPRHLQSHKWADRITDLRPMIRNGMGQLYIPGSSIKGAIRTAIAYHLLKHSERYNVPKQQTVSEIEQRLRSSMGELKRKPKGADDQLFMDRLFHDFDLNYQGRTVKVQKRGANTDFMRAVSVSDSQPILPTKTTNATDQTVYKNLPIVAEVLVSSHFPDGKAKERASIYTEMVRSLSTEFTLSVDQTMLSWFHHRAKMQIPFQSVEDILTICQEFAQDQWDFERDYWNQIKDTPTKDRILDFERIRTFYEPETCSFGLRMGWASGMAGTTVNMLLDGDLWADVRDTCGIKAPGFEAPKSRRTVVAKNGNIQFPLGWVKLSRL
jgi:CRISPR-associated protein Csm5